MRAESGVVYVSGDHPGVHLRRGLRAVPSDQVHDSNNRGDAEQRHDKDRKESREETLLLRCECHAQDGSDGDACDHSPPSHRLTHAFPPRPLLYALRLLFVSSSSRGLLVGHLPYSFRYTAVSYTHLTLPTKRIV